ncbi:hypothetical protein BDN70DRAFT_871911, partial [Pholiota conissans]
MRVMADSSIGGMYVLYVLAALVLGVPWTGEGDLTLDWIDCAVEFELRWDSVKACELLRDGLDCVLGRVFVF